MKVSNDWIAKNQAGIRKRQLSAPIPLGARVVMALLDAAGESYEREWPVPGTGYVADFYVQRINTIFECDGYLHRIPAIRARDMIRDDFLAELGYQVVRIDISTGGGFRVSRGLGEEIELGAGWQGRQN